MANSYGFDPVAWSVDGGRHRGELLRVLAYAATGGAEGIVSPPDCKVHQLTVPGSQIAIDAGALLIRNRSANVRNQTYAANGRVETRLDVTPTPSGAGRSDAVLVRIEDPQYAGFPKPTAGQEADWQYVKPVILQNVGANITNAAQLNLGYPAVMLARLDIPANTSVITNGMIKDMRKIAQPRRQRTVRIWRPTESQTYGPPGSTDWGWMPRTNQLIECPEWATELKMVVTIGNLLHIGDLTGGIRAEYGWNGAETLYSEVSGLHHADLTSVGERDRVTIPVGFEKAIPAGMRGKSHYVRTGTQLNAGTTGRLTADVWTTIVVDLEFVEVPD